MEENIFEYAVKNKLRFPFKGQISVEDLWDLNESQLDSVFKALNSQKKTVDEVSLLGKKTKEDTELAIKIQIVTHIFSSKETEYLEKQKAYAKAEKKRRLAELIAEKEDEALSGKSIEELKKMLDEIG